MFAQYVNRLAVDELFRGACGLHHPANGTGLDIAFIELLIELFTAVGKYINAACLAVV